MITEIEEEEPTGFIRLGLGLGLRLGLADPSHHPNP